MNSDNTFRLYGRQRILLSLLQAIGEAVGNPDFQKLLFFYCNMVEKSPSYTFVPHQYGAFSFTSYVDRRKLVELDLIDGNTEYWRLTARGNDYLRHPGSPKIKLTSDWSALRGDALIAESYRRFPFYATRSTITAKVLADDRESLEKIRKARCKEAKAPLLTIGYEGHSIESYLNILLKNGVTLLCDVRKNPLSRKFGFSKAALARCCREMGIKYFHIPSLGIASDKRKNLEEQSDYDALFAEYQAVVLPGANRELQTIQEMVRGGEIVALTCYEHAPQQCHRSCVSEALMSKYGETCRVAHL